MLNFNTEFLFGPNLVELLEIGSDEIDYNVDIDMGAAAGEVRVGKSQFLRYHRCFFRCFFVPMVARESPIM